MKSYRYVVLVVLVVSVLGGWISLARTNIQAEETYTDYITAARANAELGVTNEVLANYRGALSVRDSHQVALELTDYIRDNSSEDDYLKQLRWMMANYPDGAESYERIVDIYIANEDYSDAFEVLRNGEKNGLESPKLAATYDAIAYDYTLAMGGYLDVISFGDSDIATVRLDDGWHFVRSGGRVVPGAFDQAGAFAGKYGSVVLDELPSYVDDRGRTAHVATKVDYRSYGTLANGIIPAETGGGEFVFLSTEFQPLFGGQTYAAVSSFVGGLAAVEVGSGWDVIDLDGAVVASGYEDVALSDAGAAVGQGRYFAEEDGAFYLFNQEGERVVETAFDDAVPFNVAGPAAVAIDGKWGFVDAEGEFIIEPQFAEARSFANGLAAVRVGDLWGYVEVSGKVVIEPTFVGASDFASNGVVFVASLSKDEEPSLVWNLLSLIRFKD